MKKSPFLLVLLLMVFSFSSLHAQEYMKKKKGLYKKKYSNGQIQTTGMIENHFKTGEWKDYTFKGELEGIYTYTNGLLNGPFSLYNSNGLKIREGTYTNNTQTGELTDWYMNGKKRSVQHLNAEGKNIGLQEYWKSDGKRSETIFFREDGTKQVITYADGRIVSRMQFRDKKLDGPQYYYPNTNGKNPLDTFPDEIRTYHQGVKQGATRLFGKNHVLIAEYYYKNDMRDSIAREWNENGELKFEFQYKEDQLNGHCINYENGKKSVEGGYKDGKLEGLHIQYAGELCYTWYSNDEMDSCRCYHNNKKLRLHYTMLDPAQQLLKGTEYDTLGKKSKDWMLLHNLTEGIAHYYHPNGKIKSTFNYHEGYPTGIVKAWSLQGKQVLDVPLDSTGYSTAIEAWTDAGVKLNKGTVAFNAQVKKYLPSELYFDEQECSVSSDWEEEPPMMVSNEEPPIAELMEEQDKIFVYAEQMPEFPGLPKYLEENLNYPELEQQKRMQGTVYISFVIEKDGKVSNVQVIKSVKEAPGFSDEAVRVISAMPNWTPGKMNDRPVRVRIIQPVKFMLEK